MSHHESTGDPVDESAADAPDEVVDRTDQGLGNNPYANQVVRRVGDPDEPGHGPGHEGHEPVGFDPGTMTDGSTRGAAVGPDRQEADGAQRSAPDGEPVDPTGGSSDGGESGQDAGLSS